MKNFTKKFSNILDLVRLAERAFLFKLRKRLPNLTPDDEKRYLSEWYRTRPEAPIGDAEGTPVDISRFQK